LIENEPDGSLDKAKPFVRKGRKAAGLLVKMAELPKDEPPVSSAFCFQGSSRDKAAIAVGKTRG